MNVFRTLMAATASALLLSAAVCAAVPAGGANPAAPAHAPDSAAKAAPADSAPPPVAAPAPTPAQAPADSAASAAAPAGDSAKAALAKDSGMVDTAKSSRFYDYVAHPVLQVAMLPVDMVLVPAVRTLIYPIKDPLRYVLRNDVIDRTIQLISFGEKEQVMLYPTLNLASGTGSYTGLSLRHRSVFGRPTEKLVAMGLIYVNGDWKFRSYLTFSEILGTNLESKFSLQFNRVKNTSVTQPDTTGKWFYADTSNILYGSLAHPLFERFALKGLYVFKDNHFGKAPPQEDSLTSPFFPKNELGIRDPRLRGLEKDWHDHILSVGLSRDTRNNENIPLAGSNLSVSTAYHLTDAGHDYYSWEGTWTGYYKLGKERYEISAEEERKAGGMDVKKILKQMEMRKLRSQLVNRKVVALHIYSAQSFEVEGNRMPVYGLNTLGNGTPMRGYAGSRFRDYTVLSAGGEYRFPVIRLMDGVLFNEYGVYGRSWDEMKWEKRLRNSWGFGVNVRRPDIFLFQVMAGFHGLHGVQLNMSVDAYY